MTVRFTPNTRFDPKKLPGFKAHLRRAGEEVGNEAEHIASEVSSSYECRVEDKGDIVTVVAESQSLDAAGWIEFGSTTLPALAPLRKGVEAAGLELRG